MAETNIQNNSKRKIMRTRNLLLSSLALLAVLAGVALASPVELYLVKFASGTDVYRLAGSQGWPLYHISGQQALVGKQLSGDDDKAVLGSSLVYRGSSEGLRWVHLKRNGSRPSSSLLYSGNGIMLTDAEVKSGKDYNVREFSPQPMTIRATTSVSSKSLARDTMIAALTHLIDTAGVRADIEALQAFNTRSTAAPNHQQVTEWIRDEFLSYGITDVVIDSFVDQDFTDYTQYYFGNSEVYKIRNVIATIPGALDTESVYIVGGHFDTSVWPYNPWAPGADDNGSGTTAVLQAARILAANPPNTTVRLVAFDCEEWGLYGSWHHAAQALAQGMKVQCMLNYDMIGSIGNDSLFVSKLYPGSESYAHLLGQMAAWYGRTADTNLVAEYNSVYLSGSDSWEYYTRGFPVTYGEELEFSPVYHQTNDSTTYMNMRYATSIIKAGMGLLGTLANYPQKVGGLEVTDVGTGDQLYVRWQPNQAANVAGYKVYWGKVSGLYTDSRQVSGTSDTISGLSADSLYFIGLTAVDTDGKESPLVTEATGTPRSAPLPPSGLVALPVDSGITLNWKNNLELDLEGYIVYRKIDAGSFDSLSYTADTIILDKPLSGASRYYYKVQARDSEGNKGLVSDSVYSRPITLDQGILVVDETQNWTTGSFPRDAQQDSFYNYLLEDNIYEQYEFGSSAQKPALGNLGPYSTVLWHSDDPSQFLASNDSGAIREYLNHGGKLCFTGWKPSADIRNSAIYPASFGAGNILYDCFNISNVELSGTTDSFKTATGLKGFPSINVDTLKYPSTIWGKVMRNIEALTPAGSADTIYVMDMKNNGSAYEGRACAVRDSGKTVFFGFPLYYMDRDQAKEAIQKVMAEFGEPFTGVEGKPGDREQARALRLFQNSPNPFRQTTIIKYQLPKAGLVSLKIYNIAGQTVKILVNSVQSTGSYDIKWDGRDDKGLKVSNGVYVYKLEAAGVKSTKKMLLLR
jgi:hypothetical protein